MDGPKQRISAQQLVQHLIHARNKAYNLICPAVINNSTPSRLNTMLEPTLQHMSQCKAYMQSAGQLPKPSRHCTSKGFKLNVAPTTFSQLEASSPFNTTTVSKISAHSARSHARLPTTLIHAEDCNHMELFATQHLATRKLCSLHPF